MKKQILILAVLLYSSISIFAQAKGDPWIKDAYVLNYGRQPTAFEYNIYLYNNGSWSSYDQLQKLIVEFQNNMKANNITFKTSEKSADGKVVVGLFQNGVQLAANLIGLDGGTLVAAGGGNLVAAGGGNLVAAGGGNLVAAGGGNIAVTTSTPGFNFGSAYGTLAVGIKRVKTSSKGALIIR